MSLEAMEDDLEHVQDVISLLSRVTWLFPKQNILLLDGSITVVFAGIWCGGG